MKFVFIHAKIVLFCILLLFCAFTSVCESAIQIANYMTQQVIVVLLHD